MGALSERTHIRSRLDHTYIIIFKIFETNLDEIFFLYALRWYL
jgi:hypothetical protein